MDYPKFIVLNQKEEFINLIYKGLDRGSYMSAHVLFHLFNKLRKRDKNERLAEHFITFLECFKTVCDMQIERRRGPGWPRMT